MNVNRARAQFWRVADFFRSRSKEWSPVNAGYELRRTIVVHDKHWTVCLKVHALEANRHGLVRFKSSVTLWPPALTRSEAAQLKKHGWYAAVEKTLADAGYDGRWNTSPDGTWGDFWKDLPNIAAVRREADWLAHERLNIFDSGSGRAQRGRLSPHSYRRR